MESRRAGNGAVRAWLRKRGAFMARTDIGSNLEWQKWGEVDPLYAVSTWVGREKGGDNAWTDEEFYALGAMDWRLFQEHWQRYGLEDDAGLEIGCGAGRITMHLGRFFRRTIAVDVSDGMLDYARKHITDASVTFHLTNGIDLPAADNSLTGVFSTDVFQHFDAPEVGAQYFREIARALRPGGTMMIGLPIFNWPSSPRIYDRLHTVRCALSRAKAGVRRRLIARGLASPIMQWTSYPVRYLFSVLPELGFQDVELAAFARPSNPNPLTFVFARKRRDG
jgi:ubiquinone/menaquinone biosynthesis C-methylase UbiE